jgi:cytochrome c oxidase subunit II
MRLILLGVVGLVAMAVFSTIFLSLWSTRRCGARAGAFRQSLVIEFIWTAIPCLMVLAAAIPAVVAVVLGPSGR